MVSGRMTILLSDSGTLLSMVDGSLLLPGDAVSLDGFTMLWKVCKRCFICAHWQADIKSIVARDPYRCCCPLSCRRRHIKPK